MLDFSNKLFGRIIRKSEIYGLVDIIKYQYIISHNFRVGNAQTFENVSSSFTHEHAQVPSRFYAENTF